MDKPLLAGRPARLPPGSWASSRRRSTDCDSRGRAMSVHATAFVVDAKCRRRSIRAARCVHAMSPATPPRHCTVARPGQLPTREMKRSSDCSDVSPPAAATAAEVVEGVVALRRGLLCAETSGYDHVIFDHNTYLICLCSLLLAEKTTSSQTLLS